MMAKRKQLSKRQLAVIEDLFSGELDERVVLEKHEISRGLFSRWLADESFAEEYERRIAWLYRQNAATLAQYAPMAASKLLDLTDCKKEDVARRACVDIITMGSPNDKNPLMNQGAKYLEGASSATDQSPISPQTAGKLLAVLAEEKSD
jgi:hypothetical protein